MKKKLRLGIEWPTHFLDHDGNKIHNRKEINNLISNYYKKLYDVEQDQNLTQVQPQINFDVNEKEPEFLKDEVNEVVKRLKSNKSPGHDRIKNEHIKQGNDKLIQSLTSLFNTILETRKIPNEWKLSDIIIIHKKRKQT